MPKRIDDFRGRYWFLSNFSPSSIHAEGCGKRVLVRTLEHAFQAMKATRPKDFDRICAAADPKKAKFLGNTIPARSDWNAVRLTVMERLLREKFSAPRLRAKLTATGDGVLIEGNTWRDTYWGVYRGRGNNHLGRLLMKVRAECLASNCETAALDHQELCTILAALRYYQGSGMGEPGNRSSDIHEIATDGGDQISMDEEGIDSLCQKINTHKCRL